MVHDWYVDWLSAGRGIDRGEAEKIFGECILVLKENDIEDKPAYCQLKSEYIIPMLVEMGALKFKK